MIDPSVTSWAKKGVRQLNSTHILLIINHIPYTCKRSCHNSSSGLFAKKKRKNIRGLINQAKRTMEKHKWGSSVHLW